MSGLIKRSDATTSSAKVEDFLAARPAPPKQEQVLPVETLRLRRELESLGARSEQQDAEIERLKADVSRAYRDGEAEGLKAGRKEAEDRNADALRLLGWGIEAADAELKAALTSVDRLAVQLAREGLRKVLGEARDLSDLVARIIRERMQAIEAQSMLYVEVSSHDFGDAAALDQLASAVGSGRLNLRARDDLEPGGCRIKLALGALDVGVDQQWGRLEELLSAMGEPGAAA
jgi:flagellar assembly protein FliH